MPSASNEHLFSLSTRQQGVSLVDFRLEPMSMQISSAMVCFRLGVNGPQMVTPRLLYYSLIFGDWSSK
jgi:hypothetical protein